jgi:nitrous oxidase accessory protein NosD
MRLRVPIIAAFTCVALALTACGGAPSDSRSSEPLAPETGLITPSPPAGGGQVGSTLPERPPAPTPAPPKPAAYAHEWVVSPDGDDAAAGTPEAPLRTISRAISLAKPGHLIRVRSGTYAEHLDISGDTQAGTADAPITLLGEGKPRLLPNGKPGAQVIIERPHWIVRGLEIDMQGGAAYAAMFAGNVQGSVLADSEIHHAKYNAGVSFHRGADGATLENNHIHHIWIAEGKDAHGVVVQPTARNITIRNNVIHDNSGDSIQCHSPDGSVPAEPANNVLIEGNDLYGNYEQSLDIKTCHNVTVRRNKMHDNWVRGNGAMVVHMSARNILIEENDFYHAGLGVGIGGNLYGPVISGVVIQRNRFRDMRTDGGHTGGGVRLGVSDGATVLHNTFTRLPGPALEMGDGSSGPTRNPLVKNNLFDVSFAVKLRSAYSGLKMGGNLYRPGATFSKGGTLDFTKWKAQGLDATSLQADPKLEPNTLVPGPAAVDRGEKLGISFCGTAPDIGFVETGC